MIGRSVRGHHFYEDTNRGDFESRSSDPFSSARIRNEEEYTERKVGYTNTDSWYGMS